MSQSYHIIISQVFSILYISNNTALAVQKIMLLIHTLESNGFLTKRLQNRITNWLLTWAFPATKINIDTTIQFINR